MGALRLWHATPGKPLSYGGDARLYASVVVDGTLEDGWYLENERLAAPFGQKMYDYPFESGAPVALAAVYVLGRAAGETFAAMNAFFLLSFPAVALAAFLVLRRLRISRPSALVCSVLFSLLPYHFYRGEDHLFLSAYYAVPVGAYLVLRVFDERQFTRGRLFAALALSAVVGTGGTYYAGFTLVLLAAAAVVAAAARRRLAPLVRAAAAAAGIAAVLLLEHVPSLVYRAAHGAGAAAERRPVESELFSLKLADLVLPLESHRLGFLAGATRRYRDETVLPSEAGTTLGTLGTLAFVFLLGVAVAAVAAPRRLRPRRPMLRAAAVVALLAFVLATTGGLSTVLAYTVTPQLRAWSRMGIFIAFFALFALAVGLDRLLALLRRRRYPRLASVAALVAVLAIGLADQTSDAFIPNYGGISDAFGRDRTFVRAIEARLPGGSAVFQLPYLPFPEGNEAVPPRMVVYDQLAGHLHSKRLRWSFGGVKGGPEDWPAALARRPLPEVLVAVSGEFAGLEVDRFGYPDGAAALERDLRLLLGERPLVSPDRRRAFYDLRPLGRLVLPPALLREVRDAAYRPPRLEWGPDFHREDVTSRARWRWTRRPRGELRLENPAAEPQRVVLSFRVATIDRPAATALVWPDGRRQSFRLGKRELPLRRSLVLPPGTSRLRFETAAPSAVPEPGDRRRGLYLRFIDADLVPTALARAAREAFGP